MMVMVQDGAIFSAQMQKESIILKKTAVRGSIQQTIKKINGNFRNYDYELIHHINL